MKLALGCGGLGDPTTDEAQVTALLRGALDRGVTLFDAARSYGLAEERLGRVVAPSPLARFSTKGGYGVEPIPEWTGPAVRASIERACERLRVDRLEIFHLHSCPLAVLQRPGLVEALHQARAAGRIARAGYAGDGDALVWAVESGAFDAVEASFSLFDQANGPTLLRARAKGIWVLAKRPLGGAVWSRPAADDATRAYRHRFELMGFEAGAPMDELAARFVAHAPEIDVMVLGTRRLEHLEAVAAAIARGPLPEPTARALREKFAAHGAHWPALT